MTKEIAIKEFKTLCEINEHYGNGKNIELFQTAISALEKEVPKKPTFEGDGYADGLLVYDTWICPNCGKDYEVDYDYYDYCPNCGQHINFGF